MKQPLAMAGNPFLGYDSVDLNQTNDGTPSTIRSQGEHI
jgi:hypothetical protein